MNGIFKFFKYLGFFDFPIRSKGTLCVPVAFAQTLISRSLLVLYPGIESSRRETRDLDGNEVHFSSVSSAL